jgi:hypothetical protein
MARVMRRMSEETGEPLEAEDAEMIERMESGEMPPDDTNEDGEGGGDGDD